MVKYIGYLTFTLLMLAKPNSEVLANNSDIFKSYYFEDVDDSFNFNSIKTQKLKLVKNNALTLGFTKSTVWIKIILQDSLPHLASVLEFRSPLLDEIIIQYKTKDNKTVLDTLGIQYSQSKNKLNHYCPAFKIPTNQLSSPEIYLKVKSRWTMSVVPTISEINTFYKHRIYIYTIASLILGGLIFMAIYNLFLCISLRDFSYLLYVLALISSILTQGYLFGIFMQFLSPESPEFSYRIPVYVMAGVCIFSSWFTIQFLGLNKKDGLIFYALIGGILLTFFTLALEVFQIDALSRKVTLVQNLIIAGLIFIASVYSLVKKKKIALFFIIAWTLYIVGVFLFGLKAVGILPSNNFTEYFAHIGCCVEVMVLSFALGHKYNLVRLEKEKLEKQTRKELEKLVNIQTLELENSLEEKEILLKEIHHRVKNNLQIIISLLDLQLASFQDEKNKKILMQSKARIYSMSLIHQKLYQSENLTNINLKNYIEELFSYVKNSYTNKAVDYSISVVNIKISLNQSVSLGLIVNELLTNSIKYGLNPEKSINSIKLLIKANNKNLNLIIADSGTGYNFDKKLDVQKSLGLFLVKSLTRQLRGTIKTYSEQNLFVTELNFPIKG